MKRTCTILLVVLFIGCDVSNSSVNQLEEVSFKTEQNRYASNATVTLTLVNDAEEKVGFNLSCSRLQRKLDDRWVKVKEVSYCLQYMKVIQPGEKAQYKIYLGDSYNLKKTGKYRVATEVAFKGRDVRLFTAPFTVTPGFELY